MTLDAMKNTALPIKCLDLKHQLQERLSPAWLEVIDESAAHAGHAGANTDGFGSHFRIRIASVDFTGKTRLASHRLVYDALQNFMEQGLHALAIEIIPLESIA